MPEQAGNRLDVRPIVEDIHGERMTGSMPAYVLVYPCSFHPTLDGFAATFIRRQVEDESVFVTVCRRFSYKRKKPVIKRNDHTATGGMTFGLVLLKF